MQLSCRGLPLKDIAHLCNIKVGTAKLHRRRALIKLQCLNIVQATLKLFKAGLLVEAKES